jgi:RND family efflux transporter MFP subunit
VKDSKMNKFRHSLASSAVGALAALTLLVATGCGTDSTEQTAEVARPAKIFTVRAPGEGAPRVFPGQVQAAQRVPLAFRVAGPVVDLTVSKGQRVKEGELLARIDPRDYQVRVKDLEAQLAEKRAQLLQSTEEYQRVRGLFQHDNASKSDFERARAAVDVGEAQVASTEQALQASRSALSDTELRAPFDGVVADRLVDAHQVLNAGQPVVLFQDMKGLEVLIDVPEREVTALTGKAPRAIVVRFGAFPGLEFPARVKEFATEADRQTQTFPVTLNLDRVPQDRLLPGMTAAVSWHTANGNGHGLAVTVPLASVVTDSAGQPFVWRVDPNTSRVSRVVVTTGALTDSGMEVLEGLDAGDQILAAGAHFVTDGQLVRPLQD